MSSGEKTSVPLKGEKNSDIGHLSVSTGSTRRRTPVQLQQIGRMAEPHQRILRPLQTVQIGFQHRKRRRRFAALFAPEENTPHAARKPFVGSHLRRRMQVAELPVAVIGRTADTFQPLAARQAAETPLIDECDPPPQRATRRSTRGLRTYGESFFSSIRESLRSDRRSH